MKIGRMLQDCQDGLSVFDVDSADDIRDNILKTGYYTLYNMK